MGVQFHRGGCVDTGELKVSQSKRTYLITMSTFQMAMLLMFEKVRVGVCVCLCVGFNYLCFILSCMKVWFGTHFHPFVDLRVFIQWFVLLQVDSLTCQELQTHTHLNDEQFTKFLQSLLDSKLLLTDAEVSPPLLFLLPQSTG